MAGDPILRDPHYRRIFEALGGHLDPAVFERVMAGLLRRDFPGLVPVVGGKDGGMDAAIPDGEGVPFPLVCTVGLDVEGNLRDSLRSHAKRDWTRRLAAVATSQEVSPTRRYQLHELAQGEAFQLLQVFDRHALTERLYFQSFWCQELLGVTVGLSALTTVPRSRRPLLNLDLIAREEDLAWLRTTEGDRVLVGQPGAGKTFLLWKLAQEGLGLFLDSSDEDKIASALLDLQPAVVFVDDAHAYPERIELLRTLRDGRVTLERSFAILASTWPGSLEDTQNRFGHLPGSRVRTLELLSRTQIHELYERMGLRDLPSEVLRNLIDQAANKPGLAVMLAQLWLQGSSEDWKDVLSGHRLTQQLLADFRDLTGTKTEEILGCFALGGDAGLAQQIVAERLGLDLPEVRQTTAGLAAGGVLHEVDQGRLAVIPKPLRWSLVKRVFFSNEATDLLFEPILASLEGLQRESAIEAILGGLHRGRRIDPDQLRGLVKSCQGVEVWEGFAALGREESLWALENGPWAILVQAAKVLLEHAFEEAASWLLHRTQATETPQRLHDNAALNALVGWVQDTEVRSQEWIERRRRLARIARRFLAEGGSRHVGLVALSRALSPRVSGSRSDPVYQAIGTLRWGHLSGKPFEQLLELWTDTRESLSEFDSPAWCHISSALENLLNAGGLKQTAALTTILQDLADRNRASLAIQSDLHHKAQGHGLAIEARTEPDFELLFNWDSPGTELALEALAGRWSRLPPQEAAAHLSLYLHEARKISRDSCVRPVKLMYLIAARTSEPESWAKELISAELPGQFIRPFLEILATSDPSNWRCLVPELLGLTGYGWVAAESILQREGPEEQLLCRTLDLGEELISLVETLALRRAIPVPNLRALLQHSDWRVALAAATGEWSADPVGEVREELSDNWRDAILRSLSEEWPDVGGARAFQVALGEILASDADLSSEWILLRLRDPKLPSVVYDRSALREAAAALSKEHRASVVRALPAAPLLDDLLPILVARNLDLYRALLDRKDLKPYWLAPLHGRPDHEWADMAWLAVQAGRDPEEVAAESYWDKDPNRGPIPSSELERWQAYEAAFEGLMDDPRAEVREVARNGLEEARRRIAQAQKHDRQQELHGYFPR